MRVIRDAGALVPCIFSATGAVAVTDRTNVECIADVENRLQNIHFAGFYGNVSCLDACDADNEAVHECDLAAF
ncbi:hypothetical protein AMTR_s00001p00272930 [Amborella trichopoda]|uniref:Uncharacterized protein n=1 Tax=Amborella trichopoda TaxID=13333 RepID=W1NN35_AMBTC|nr:hypothetical protein AMTR_s00001p00272930 [Amborella trichopoda]